MTCRAGRSPAVVAFASPVSQPPRRAALLEDRGPAARWIAPSTPPPPSSDEFAAFTIASTVLLRDVALHELDTGPSGRAYSGDVPRLALRRPMPAMFCLQPHAPAARTGPARPNGATQDPTS